MNSRTIYTTLLPVFAIIILSWMYPTGWYSEKDKHFTIYYQEKDNSRVDEYLLLAKNCYKRSSKFFSIHYKSSFDIYIHPDRSSLDKQWEKDWGMKGFRSECWMVASGIATRLDMISPATWDSTSCEHSNKNRTEAENLIVHELVHVLHGQYNESPDFSNTEGMDWFIEGLATYASGQFSSPELDELKEMVKQEKYPDSLDKFWTGKYKYILSGSVVMYIDRRFGRQKLGSLLTYNKKTQVLASLQLTEQELLSGWKSFITK